MIEKKLKKNNCLYFISNKHKEFLIKLPKLTQKTKYFKVFYQPREFRNALLHTILCAKKHIFLVALYLENDHGGKKIIDALLYVKQLRPNITIKILVDWHRAKRNRIGQSPNQYTNIDWYNDLYKKSINEKIFIYGIPLNFNEILGVLHLKGFIIDDQILYSGANLNEEYLHIHNKYRYDRYHIIRNAKLSNTMLNYIEKELLSAKVINQLGHNNPYIKKNKNNNNIRLFRRKLKKTCYYYQGNATFHEFSITPLVGLGKKSILNKTIVHLICSTQKKIILCTPYFNIPTKLLENLIYLLHQGKCIEIIVGDKCANDFYIPNNQTFKWINTLPYFYEINLRCFLKQLQNYIDNNQLIIRIWKKDNNGYHIKGIWIDQEWQLITGNNLNPRAFRLDLENALLVHDPKQETIYQTNLELNTIRTYTNRIFHYSSLQHISDYPTKIKKFIYRIRRIKFDRIINNIL